MTLPFSLNRANYMYCGACTNLTGRGPNIVESKVSLGSVKKARVLQVHILVSPCFLVQSFLPK
jgi:hypothetical protein